MSIHTFSSREFTRDVAAAKRAAADGPVFITDRGRPAFALLTIDDYRRMVSGKERSLLELGPKRLSASERNAGSLDASAILIASPSFALFKVASAARAERRRSDDCFSSVAAANNCSPALV